MSALSDRVTEAMAKIAAELQSLLADAHRIENDIHTQANGDAQRQISIALANAQDLVASTKVQADQSITLARQEFKLEMDAALAKQKADLTPSTATTSSVVTVNMEQTQLS